MKYSAQSIEDYYTSMARGKIPQTNMYIMQKGRGSTYNRKTKPLYYVNQSGGGPKIISPLAQDLQQARVKAASKGIKRTRRKTKPQKRKRSRRGKKTRRRKTKKLKRKIKNKAKKIKRNIKKKKTKRKTKKGKDIFS